MPAEALGCILLITVVINVITAIEKVHSVWVPLLSFNLLGLHWLISTTSMDKEIESVTQYEVQELELKGSKRQYIIIDNEEININEKMGAYVEPHRVNIKVTEYQKYYKGLYFDLKPSYDTIQRL